MGNTPASSSSRAAASLNSDGGGVAKVVAGWVSPPPSNSNILGTKWFRVSGLGFRILPTTWYRTTLEATLLPHLGLKG